MGQKKSMTGGHWSFVSKFVSEGKATSYLCFMFVGVCIHGQYKTYPHRVCVCVCMCVQSCSAWLSQCNGTALMDPHLSWSVQSVAEVQPSLTSSPAWKPYNLLSTILVLHFTHFFLRLSISVSINLIFLPFFIDLHRPALFPQRLCIKPFYPGSENGETRISILSGWSWTFLPFFFSHSLCSKENEIREDDM